MDEGLNRLDERRLEARLNRPARVWLETVSPVPGEDETAEVLECMTVDMSTNGMQLETDQPLLIDSILPIYVETMDGKQYCLTGEVRWVRPASPAGRYLLGFHLYESEQTSILEWKQYIASLL